MAFVLVGAILGALRAKCLSLRVGRESYGSTISRLEAHNSLSNAEIERFRVSFLLLFLSARNLSVWHVLRKTRESR